MSWAFQSHQYPQQSSMLEVLMALEVQDGIHWTPFVEGCIAQEWTDIQDQHYKSIGCWRSGRRWTIELIKKLLDVAWDLWEHHNAVLHHKDNQATKYNMQSMHGKICSQYCIGAGSMPSWVEYLFMGRVEDLLSLSVHYQIKWLEAVQKA